MVETAAEESPWSDPAPSYRAVPPTNPKTGEPVQLYVCTECGAVAVSRKIHSNWHRDRASRRSY